MRCLNIEKKNPKFTVEIFRVRNEPVRKRLQIKLYYLKNMSVTLYK